MQYFLLFLIPVCSYLNHLGGQSLSIPNPRITCRVIGLPLVFLGFCLMAGFTTKAYIEFGIAAVGIALWAIPKWGPGFMTVWPVDHRDYNNYAWLTHTVDKLVGVTQATLLTERQCYVWGVVYFTLRGGFLYPMFLGFSYFTPWALIIGLGSFLMGIIYYLARLVLRAEYIQGALIGTMWAAIIFLTS